MQEITMYTTSTCPYCRAARELFRSKNIRFIEIDVQSTERRTEMINRSGRRTVPQIYFGDQHIGGYDDLAQIESNGELFEKLAPL
ncbi:glutaredoxin 3 [Pseudomonas sp. P2498]|uniref:Glutaredoxin n=2 Tax=Pseudomonas petrae TaxID=2912190 RepID=A0ABS9IA63_9PSED|nr:glutaredoxin 3 [Pseudomonas petrae]MCF7536648.1 glutaredoxin 3 [Pseudomonas petrae]MCF7544259.1 glutaredoxin 3 [Pseudomonas petrae]MCF7554328.1 glutaredoxin 3 [Pseudomonas petrae]